jgi:hypothetical protein
MDTIANNHIYDINVSGKIYHIKHDILKEIPYFHEYINEFINNKEIKCFVQRSSMIFHHVLAYKIDPLHPYPSKYFYELDFYGLSYDKPIYKVNVLGKIYYLKRDILMQIPYFVNVINKVNQYNSSIEIYVDRSSLLFEQVVSYVMDEKYPIDCYDELNYYGIVFNQHRLYNTELHNVKESIIGEILHKLNDMQHDIVKINNKINDNSVKKTCDYRGCVNLIDIDSDSNYCDNHNDCQVCYRDAYKSNNYLCPAHQ